MIMALKLLAGCAAVLIVYIILLNYALASASNYCSQRTPTDGFAEQNGRDAERAD